MTPLLRTILISSLAFAIPALAEEDLRTWTSSAGQTFKGTYLSCTAEKVTIRREDGKTVLVERAKLSEDDQHYVDLAFAGLAGPPSQKPAPADPEPSEAAADPLPPKKFDFRPSVDFIAKMLLGYDGSKPNFTAPWPKEIGVDVEPEIVTLEEDAAKKSFIYESPHFHFQSNVLLKPSLLAKVAVMFEATFKMHHDVPLNNRRTRSEKAAKLRARLFETSEEYHAAGGPSGSAGVYRGGNIDEFMVPLDELGVKKVGSGYMFDYRGNFHTMYHELTHQLWGDIPELAGMWMVEGFAEFMACAPFSNGKFSFTKQADYLMAYATGFGKKDHGGRDLGKDIVYPHLEEIMAWDQPKFYSDGNRNYGLGLLLVNYFVLMDGDGDKVGENFKKCIKACQDGQSEAAAREMLLAGRTYEQLEKDFASAMRKKGIKITYE
ncbi:MAG: hypothetical protein JWO82_2015 [Akkermansiaceae bacterium]|nr:hypothetical protein [Akkermansiaceae bacterium]